MLLDLMLPKCTPMCVLSDTAVPGRHDSHGAAAEPLAPSAKPFVPRRLTSDVNVGPPVRVPSTNPLITRSGSGRRP
jgi:hypothetical protein